MHPNLRQLLHMPTFSYFAVHDEAIPSTALIGSDAFWVKSWCKISARGHFWCNISARGHFSYTRLYHTPRANVVGYPWHAVMGYYPYHHSCLLTCTPGRFLEVPFSAYQRVHPAKQACCWKTREGRDVSGRLIDVFTPPAGDREAGHKS